MRVIGSPQWSNVSRTFDTGRVYYRTNQVRLELLMVSPVKVLPDQFNVPELGERIWGTYGAGSGGWRMTPLHAYGTACRLMHTHFDTPRTRSAAGPDQARSGPTHSVAGSTGRYRAGSPMILRPSGSLVIRLFWNSMRMRILPALPARRRCWGNR